MMNQPLRRVDPLGRSATPAPDRETHAPSATSIGGAGWPIRDGSMRPIVDSAGNCAHCEKASQLDLDRDHTTSRDPSATPDGRSQTGSICRVPRARA